VGPDGNRVGEFATAPSKWSPDDRWIAVIKELGGSPTLWIVNSQTGHQRRVSDVGQEVRDFYWDDRRRLVFEIVSNAATLRRFLEEGYQRGYLADQYRTYADVTYPRNPGTYSRRTYALYSADISRIGTRSATAAEARRFNVSASKNRLRAIAGVEQLPELKAPELNGNVHVWLDRGAAAGGAIYPTVSLIVEYNNSLTRCADAPCRGPIFSFNDLWLSPDKQEIVFWRRWGDNQSEDALFVWNIHSGVVSKIRDDPDEELSSCVSSSIRTSRIVCIQEARLQPPELVSIDTRTGKSVQLFDPNAWFRDLRLPGIERFQWTLSAEAFQLGYPHTGHGYIIYPPGFDPKRRYPVIICPYRAQGFIRGDGGDENPMLLYAAAGFVVINTEFPVPWSAWSSPQASSALWAREQNFPHMRILAQSTFAALDTVEDRGFIDDTRVGIGGVSQGTAEPMLMLQMEDRFSAVIFGSAANTQLGGYVVSITLKRKMQKDSASVAQADDYWVPVDLSYHVEEIEAPILYEIADSELVFELRLFHELDVQRLPYELHIFPDETHFKWQPLHRLAIYNRNLDWFRFWLQDYVDPDSAKKEQYVRWRQLRSLQCKNPRSIRDYCDAQSEMVSVAH
jgi:hypothetical protein